MIFSLFFPFLLATTLCKAPLTTSIEFTQFEKNVEKKMREASHLVPIAQEADSVLSKLISNKSPTIMSWIEKRKLLSAKEEEIAGEWRFYYLDQFILSQFPTTKPRINSSVEKLFSDINEIAFSSDDKKRIQQSFENAKNDTQKYVTLLKIEEDSKKEILTRINTISLYWFEKLKGSRYQNKPFEFLKWGLAYDPPTHQINVGLLTKQYPDDETLYSVFIHEIAHSFDPCRWGAFLKTKNPFDSLYKCLRGAASAGALARDDAKMKMMIEQKKLSPEMADSLVKNPYCNRSFYPPEGTQKEQLPEVFADWVSAEVLANSTFPLKTLRSDLCKPHELMKGSSYLTNQERLEKIYFAQPTLKKKFSLESKSVYCPVQ